MVVFTTLNSSNADLIEVGVCWVWMDGCGSGFDRGFIGVLFSRYRPINVFEKVLLLLEDV
jgi:hypothetical protein